MHLGLIGYGTIGQTLTGLLGQYADPAPSLTILTRPASAQRVAALAPHNAQVVSDLDRFIATHPDLVIECAGAEAVNQMVPACLEAGIDTLIASVGALSLDDLNTRIYQAAAGSGARAILPAGAIGGIDILAALKPGGINKVTYFGRKPPKAWAGSPAEDVIDLDAIAEPTVFFEGTAREAAQRYPKNANVAAAVALAGLGFDATRVRLIADPTVSRNIHEYEVDAIHADYKIRIEGKPTSGNARTSATTVFSLLREVLNRTAPVAI